MSYHFPYEDIFVLAIGGLVVALLIFRVRHARRRRKAPNPGQHEGGDA